MRKSTKKISAKDSSFPSYNEVVAKINKKVGKRPKLPSDLPKGSWTDQSLRVLGERYLRKDDGGRVVETPEDLCWRVAWDIASAEAVWEMSKREIAKIAREFYMLLTSHQFLPNSPTLMNAGTNNGMQYSGCFVLPVEDSLVGIFDAIKFQALIHQTGGGTGFSFSRLRPRGSVVKSSTGVASGPVSFMRIFDSATNEIKQGGKRRGANMGILRVDHPDILEFIHSKEGGGITNFNISVAITNKFMKSYQKGSNYNLIDPRDGSVVGELDAKMVFDEISKCAWKTGDPGLVFIDKINASKANPVPVMGPIESTNPCGEQPLYPYDSCNLGSIFLNNFIADKNGKSRVDWEKLKKVTRTATRFLDNVIEVNPYPLEEIRQVSLSIRRIGLGVGGWADMLIELEIPYDSNEALNLGEKIMKTIQTEAGITSQELAKKRGPFPLWKDSIYKKRPFRRNATVTTIAPTGSICIIAGASSGIEPLFAIAYQHVVKDKSLDRTLNFINPKFEEKARERNIWTQELKEKVADSGAVRGNIEIPEDLRNFFVTAHEVSYDWHIKHQSVFQKHIENAVSKTINLENSATVKDIKKAYLLAWDTKCKGITVFRDGCKDAQVLNLGVNGKTDEKKVIEEKPVLKRPFRVGGATYKLSTPVGTAFVTINEDADGEPLELFINVGKAGSDVTAMAEALGRSISTALRFHSYLRPTDRAKEIAYQLAGIGGRRSVGFGPNKILSLPDAVAAALAIHFGFKINGYMKMKDYVAKNMVNGEFEKARKEDEKTFDIEGAVGQIGAEKNLAERFVFEEKKGLADICPNCGAGAFVYEEGCSKCYSCGHSEC